MTATTLVHELDEDDLDLSPEMMCTLMRRRARNAVMSATSTGDRHSPLVRES